MMRLDAFEENNGAGLVFGWIRYSTCLVAEHEEDIKLAIKVERF